MKLRFEVDQAECFRNGIDCPKSIVTIEVNPANLSKAFRDLIADRLHGIDVCKLESDGKSKKIIDGKPVRIIAKAPTFEALMEAVSEEWLSQKTENDKRDSLCNFPGEVSDLLERPEERKALSVDTLNSWVDSLPSS